MTPPPLLSPALSCPLLCLGTSEHSSHILFTFLLHCHGMTTLSSVLTERANTSAPLCLTSSEFLTRKKRCGVNSLDPAQGNRCCQGDWGGDPWHRSPVSSLSIVSTVPASPQHPCASPWQAEAMPPGHWAAFQSSRLCFLDNPSSI